jgi:hypothetical protein
MSLDEGLSNYSLQTKSCLPSVFVNAVLLGQSKDYLLTNRLWLLS